MTARAQINSDVLAMVDTEAKQLQAIEDLYLILKLQPRYKKLKDPVWDVTTPPIEILTWILRKLGPLANGNRWMVDTYRRGKTTRYRFVVWKDYFSYDLPHQEQYLPLDFLPALIKRDRPLHDLIVDTVALVSKCNGIPLWDGDGDYAEELKKLKGYPSSTGNTVVDRQLASYRNGPAAIYLRLLKRRRKVVTVAGVKSAYKAYKANSDRKAYVALWAKGGIWLASQKKDLRPWSFVPHYVKGNPVGPDRQYKFIWSGHDNDILHRRVLDKMRKDAKIGDYYPVMFSITKPGQLVKALKIEQRGFPTELCWFLRNARSLFFHRYKEYFIKDGYEKFETPAEELLERIDCSLVNEVI